MSENKTKPGGDALGYIASLKDDRKRADSLTLVKLMSEVTGEEPELWGPSMIGFGRWRYRYESGREGDWFLCGFAPRAAALTIYLPGGLEQLAGHLERLGKFKTGKGCLYIKKLDDIDQTILREMVEVSSEWARTSPIRIDK